MPGRTLTIALSTATDPPSHGLAVVDARLEARRVARAIGWLVPACAMILTVGAWLDGQWLAPAVVLLFGGLLLRTRLQPAPVLDCAGGPCPHCHRRVLMGRQLLRWPLRVTCQGCRSRVEVGPVPGR